ncbi:uncharacterized protein LOC112454828 isoform X2 [Temnothorax curvispinosus]|uniref:Uncharacterized protein LOC112454828 isoform X2 n=1 Tax=Temnothorax curvispinosus TaxID=300111 RepID=A0A6J1PSA1_9HYME|nr:uncharacterized protein LOC112454828 isoform X2 [Temnothorax curvispinosus]
MTIYPSTSIPSRDRRLQKFFQYGLPTARIKTHVNLLYVQDPRNNNVGHFAWIKHLSRLVSSQINKHGHTKYICDRCLHYFSSSDKLQSHTTDCREVNNCAIRLPSADKWLSFKNHSRKERLPFVVYADLGYVLKKTTGDGTRVIRLSTSSGM